MLASLLMAAAAPEAFGDHALLFAGAYVALQVGRNVAGALLLPRDHPLRARVRADRRLERGLGRALDRGRVRWTATAASGCGSPRWPWTWPRRWSATGPRARRVAHRGLRGGGRPLRRALPGVHHHRAGRVDRRDRRHGGERRAHAARWCSRSRSRSSSRPRCGGCTSARWPRTRGATSRRATTRAAWRATPTPICTCRSSPA